MRLTVFLTLFFSLLGCSSIPEYKTVYEQNLKEFNALYPATSHRIERNGYFLHAKEYGKQNRDGDPSIILMHGFPDSLHLYDRLIPYLIEKRHVIAFDFLGWGNSDKPADHLYTSSSLKKDLEAVVQHFGLVNVTIVTHDASGPPGIEWAMENESKVGALVLLNTYYQPMATLKAPEAIALFSTPGITRAITVFVASHSDARWQAGIIEQLNKFMSDPDVREKYTKIFAYQALEIRPAFFGLNEVMREEIESRRESASARLINFRKPVVVIFGSDDPYLNKGVAQEFSSLFPNSALQLIGNAGHYVQLDKPKEVAEAILLQR